ncbi:MAG: polysaccharide deacetylase family protein [Elusimicrobia bacterium]|nr:polysaccharide deacetylase family protein [Elusimicrobiota bacterium]
MKKILFLLLIVFVFSVDSFAEKVFFADGSRNKKEIALTFDDGPGYNTEEVLSILRLKKVKATFFLLGESIESKPYLVKEIAEDGHEIASHTYKHINFYKYKYKKTEDYNKLKDKISKNLLKNQRLIEKFAGYKPKLVRFPHGYMRQPALDVARENGYKVINWSFGTDWNEFDSYEHLLGAYLEHAKPGTIFLMHDLKDNSLLVEMLPQLIDILQFVGYKFVTVSELLNFN